MLVLQTPELPRDVNRLVVLSPDPSANVMGLSRAWWEQRNRYVQARLNQIPKEVVVVDPAKIFCDVSDCFAARQGVAYYFDDDHMSVAGAGLVVNEILTRMGK